MTVAALWLWLDSVQRLLGTEVTLAVQGPDGAVRPVVEARVGRDAQGREVVILVYAHTP
jgi:hypothetical protein